MSKQRNLDIDIIIALQFLLSMISEFARSLLSLAINCFGNGATREAEDLESGGIGSTGRFGS